MHPSDSVVSLYINGDTARVETPAPMNFVLLRMRGDWVPRSWLSRYNGPPPGTMVDPRTPARAETTTMKIEEGRNATRDPMPIYPGDTRAR